MAEPEELELTPIQKLEAAVAAYFVDCEEDGDGSFLSGWLLSWQSTRIQVDPEFMPLQDTTGFVLGSQTTGTLAVGLLDITKRNLLDALAGGDDE